MFTIEFFSALYVLTDKSSSFFLHTVLLRIPRFWYPSYDIGFTKLWSTFTTQMFAYKI